jgi:CHASE3 domain sensor protein
MAVASVLVALLVGGAFAILLLTISDLRTSQREATRSREANAAADQLEERVIDLETGTRGFVITRQERFLEPWRAARAEIPGGLRQLERFAEDPEQKARVSRISRDLTSYVREYSVPLVSAVGRNEASARSIAITAEGKRRVDELRREFGAFRLFERDVLARRQQQRHECRARGCRSDGRTDRLGRADPLLRRLSDQVDRPAAAPRVAGRGTGRRRRPGRTDA